MTWELREQCTTDPMIVVTRTAGPVFTKIHLVLSTDEEGRPINAIKNGAEYLECIDGMVLESNCLKDLIDRERLTQNPYMVYDKHSQSFELMTEHEYKSMMEI